MSDKHLSRRNFIEKAAIGFAGTAVSATGLSAMRPSAYKKIIGANDRINIGFLGCGSRSRGHRHMVEMSYKDKNLGVVAVCDLWKNNREKGATDYPG